MITSFPCSPNLYKKLSIFKGQDFPALLFLVQVWALAVIDSQRDRVYAIRENILPTRKAGK